MIEYYKRFITEYLSLPLRMQCDFPAYGFRTASGTRLFMVLKSGKTCREEKSGCDTMLFPAVQVPQGQLPPKILYGSIYVVSPGTFRIKKKRKVLGEKRYLGIHPTLSCDTMKVHWIVLLIVTGAILLAPAVSAQIIENKDGYTVSTVDDPLMGVRLSGVSPMTTSVISQGETHSYTRYVYAGTTSIVSDLNWGDTADSLSLTVIAPDATLGPYYDAADGLIDGRIYLRISKTTGVTPGTWWNRIFGYQVAGTEDYSFISY